MRQSDIRKRRRRAFRLGHWAEWIAATYLFLKAYQILEIRYRTKMGEIDIVARKGDLVVMVEVKARRTISEAVDAVSYESKRRIQNAADHWLQRQRDAAVLSIRFDIIAVCPWRWPAHFKNAF